MNASALVLSGLIASADGGVEAELHDAGIYRVQLALTPEGEQLGPGWYLSPERMQKVGQRVHELEEQQEAQKLGIPFALFILLVSFAAGVATARAFPEAFQ